MSANSYYNPHASTPYSLEFEIPRYHIFRSTTQSEVVFYELQCKLINNNNKNANNTNIVNTNNGTATPTNKAISDVLFKRFSDFVNLDSKLRRNYPLVNLPSLPKKKVFGNLNTNFIEKRRKDLEYYVFQLITHTDNKIKYSKDLQAFLPLSYRRVNNNRTAIQWEIEEVTTFTKKSLLLQLDIEDSVLQFYDNSNSFGLDCSDNMSEISIVDLIQCIEMEGTADKVVLTYIEHVENSKDNAGGSNSSLSLSMNSSINSVDESSYYLPYENRTMNGKNSASTARSRKKLFQFKSSEDRFRFLRVIKVLESKQNKHKSNVDMLSMSSVNTKVEYTNLPIYCTSFNMAMTNQCPDSVGDWLPTDTNYSIIAISVQECQIALQTLTEFLSKQLKHKFTPIAKKNLWAIAMIVFVRNELIQSNLVYSIESNSIATGIMGILGNKGAVGVALKMYNFSLCFVNSHLAAHDHCYHDRNRMFQEIDSGLKLGLNEFDVSLQFDVVFWMGDLNYRVELPHQKALSLISSKEYETMQIKDQLRRAQFAQEAFTGYSEGKILFPPTYKYVMPKKKKDHGNAANSANNTDAANAGGSGRDRARTQLVITNSNRNSKIAANLHNNLTLNPNSKYNKPLPAKPNLPNTANTTNTSISTSNNTADSSNNSQQQPDFLRNNTNTDAINVSNVDDTSDTNNVSFADTTELSEDLLRSVDGLMDSSEEEESESVIYSKNSQVSSVYHDDDHDDEGDHYEEHSTNSSSSNSNTNYSQSGIAPQALSMHTQLPLHKQLQVHPNKVMHNNIIDNTRDSLVISNNSQQKVLYSPNTTNNNGNDTTSDSTNDSTSDNSTPHFNTAKRSSLTMALEAVKLNKLDTDDNNNTNSLLPIDESCIVGRDYSSSISISIDNFDIPASYTRHGVVLGESRSAPPVQAILQQQANNSNSNANTSNNSTESIFQLDPVSNSTTTTHTISSGISSKSPVKPRPIAPYGPRTQATRLRSYAKKRIPSWCDRILWRSIQEHSVRLQSYRRAELLQSSDHLAVCGEYELKIPIAPPIQCYYYPAAVFFHSLYLDITYFVKQNSTQPPLITDKIYVEFSGSLLAESSRGKRTGYAIVNTEQTNTVIPTSTTIPNSASNGSSNNNPNNTHNAPLPAIPQLVVCHWLESDIPALQLVLGFRDYIAQEKILYKVKSGNEMMGAGNDLVLGQGVIKLSHLTGHSANQSNRSAIVHNESLVRNPPQSSMLKPDIEASTDGTSWMFCSLVERHSSAQGTIQGHITVHLKE